MVLVKLKMPGGKSVWVNPDNATYVETAGPTRCKLRFIGGGDELLLEDTADIVVELLTAKP